MDKSLIMRLLREKGKITYGPGKPLDPKLWAIPHASEFHYTDPIERTQGMNEPQQERPEGEVNQAVKQLHDVAEKAAKRVDELLTRLTGVMRMEPPSTADNAKNGCPQSACEVSGQMNSAIGVLQVMVIDRLESTLGRLEV